MPPASRLPLVPQLRLSPCRARPPASPNRPHPPNGTGTTINSLPATPPIQSRRQLLPLPRLPPRLRPPHLLLPCPSRPPVLSPARKTAPVSSCTFVGRRTCLSAAPA